MISRSVSQPITSGIRPLHPARDLGQLADLVENAFGDELTEGGERVLRELRLLGRLGPFAGFFTGTASRIDGILSGFVWDESGMIVGNVTVSRPGRHPRRWQVSNVAVMDGYRQRGIGRKLVEAAIDLVLHRGGHTAYLYVRDDSPWALHLYRSLGFVPVDRTADLRYVSQPTADRVTGLSLLGPLGPGDGQRLLELVSQAAGSGDRWLHPPRRDEYVLSGDERFFRWVESFVTAETETRWGVSTGDLMEAGLSLRATRLWNSDPHRLKVWVHPSRRGRVEEALAQDVVVLLSRLARRPVEASLPACEQEAIDALVGRGFVKVRTLVLMKLEL